VRSVIEFGGIRQESALSSAQKVCRFGVARNRPPLEATQSGDPVPKQHQTVKNGGARQIRQDLSEKGAAAEKRQLRRQARMKPELKIRTIKMRTGSATPESWRARELTGGLPTIEAWSSSDLDDPLWLMTLKLRSSDKDQVIVSIPKQPAVDPILLPALNRNNLVEPCVSV